MAKALEKRKIDGREYSFGRLSPLKAVALLLKMTNMLGTSLKDGFTTNKELEGLFDADINIGTIIANLAGKLNSEMFNELAVEILSQTLYNHDDIGGPIDSEERIEIVFADTGIGHLFAVIQVAVEIEYKGFFFERLGLGSLIKKLKEKKKSMTQAKSTSTGLNGGQS